MRSLLDIFSKDPSKSWARTINERLTFHLASESLNGVRIEDPFEKISVFGRPDNRKPFEQQRFDYPDLGLEIGGENDRVKYFSFSVRSFSGKPNFCELTFISERGTQILLTKDTQFSEIENVLGKTFETEKFYEDVTYRFKYKRLNLAFEFGEDNLISFEAGLEDFV
jgi:hypothetical protein